MVSVYVTSGAGTGQGDDGVDGLGGGGGGGGGINGGDGGDGGRGTVIIRFTPEGGGPTVSLSLMAHASYGGL